MEGVGFSEGVCSSPLVSRKTRSNSKIYPSRFLSQPITTATMVHRNCHTKIECPLQMSVENPHVSSMMSSLGQARFLISRALPAQALSLLASFVDSAIKEPAFRVIANSVN
jgi:hypothetical protein